MQISHLVEKVKGRKSPDAVRPGIIVADLGVTAGAVAVCGDEFGASCVLLERAVDLCATGSRG